MDIHISPDRIMQLVQSLYDKVCHSDNDYLTEIEIKKRYMEEYKDLEQRYPGLYCKVCEDRSNFDWNEFRYMMSRISNVRRNPETLERESIHYGQKQFNKYVKPVVPQMERK